MARITGSKRIKTRGTGRRLPKTPRTKASRTGIPMETPSGIAALNSNTGVAATRSTVNQGLKFRSKINTLRDNKWRHDTDFVFCLVFGVTMS